MINWFDSLFRSSRIKKKLEVFEKTNHIIFDKHDYSWISPTGKRCVIIDINSDYPHAFSLSNLIIDFVRRRSLTGNEQFFILIIDLDKDKCIILPPEEEEECVDPSPHIYVYSFIEHLDVEKLLGEFGNRTIHLINGYYGVCRRHFNCYTKSKFNWKQIEETMGNFTPTMYSGGSSCFDNDAILFSLLAIDLSGS